MDNTTKDILPRLVEIDNLGEATASPTPYSVLWWLKKILESLGAASDPLDLRTPDYVPIASESTVEIFSYQPTVVETFHLSGVSLTYLGFSASVKILHSPDGEEPSVVRCYVLNTQKPTHTDPINTPIPLPLDGVNGYIKIVVQSNGVNKNGSAFAALNGYK